MPKDLAQTVIVDGTPVKLLPEVLSLTGIRPGDKIDGDKASRAMTLQASLVQGRAAEKFALRMAKGREA